MRERGWGWVWFFFFLHAICHAHKNKNNNNTDFTEERVLFFLPSFAFYTFRPHTHTQTKQKKNNNNNKQVPCYVTVLRYDSLLCALSAVALLLCYPVRAEGCMPLLGREVIIKVFPEVKSEIKFLSKLSINLFENVCFRRVTLKRSHIQGINHSRHSITASRVLFGLKSGLSRAPALRRRRRRQRGLRCLGILSARLISHFPLFSRSVRVAVAVAVDVASKVASVKKK